MTAKYRSVAQGLLAMAIAWVLGTATAIADEADRAKHWEISFLPVYAPSKSLSFENGTQANLDAGWGFGFGFGYNFTDHFNLGGEFAWNYVGYQGTATPAAGNLSGPVNVSGTLYTSTLRAAATYNFLKSAVTPFVSGGVGWTYVDTGVQNGPAQPFCWYYPWWGYWCGTYAPTKTLEGWSYNAGVGVRWDITRKFYARALAQEQWTQFGGYTGSQNWTSYRVDLGFKF